MPQSKNSWFVKFGLLLCTATALTLLTGCATSTNSLPEKDLILVLVACPKPTPLNDPAFGATTEKLAWYAVNYNKCRAAALSESAAKPGQ